MKKRIVAGNELIKSFEDIFCVDGLLSFCVDVDGESATITLTRLINPVERDEIMEVLTSYEFVTASLPTKERTPA